MGALCRLVTVSCLMTLVFRVSFCEGSSRRGRRDEQDHADVVPFDFDPDVPRSGWNGHQQQKEKQGMSSPPPKRGHRGYKRVSYDPIHEHLNVIDDDRPSTDLRFLEKRPYYEKKSHLLGHRGEHWTEEDRVRVKHHHSKMLHRLREQQQQQQQQQQKENEKKDRHHGHHFILGEDRKKNKHHGKVLPFDPTLDQAWRDHRLQNLEDLRVEDPRGHHDDEALIRGSFDHQQQQDAFEEKKPFSFDHKNKGHFEPEKMKGLHRGKYPTKEDLLEKTNPFDKRLHKKDNKLKWYKNKQDKVFGESKSRQHRQ